MNYKDPELNGIYVRRCVCGTRPYYDCIQEDMSSYGCWVQCNCGLVGDSGTSKTKAIQNWNDGKMKHQEDWVAIGSHEIFDKIKYELLEVLQNLHSFNKLTNVKVEKLSAEYQMDAGRLCSEFGITYNIITNCK